MRGQSVYSVNKYPLDLFGLFLLVFYLYAIIP